MPQSSQPKLYGQRSFDIIPGVNLTAPLSFYPLAVIVDNYSEYWLHVPDAGRYVPPYTVGAILPLIHAIQAYADWDYSPYGAQTITATSGEIAHLTFTDSPNLTYTGGTSVGSSPSVINQFMAEFMNQPAGNVNLTDWPVGVTRPAFTRVTLSATVRGSSPGAASAFVRVVLIDAHGNSWYMVDLLADESVPTRSDTIFKSPTIMQSLNIADQWDLLLEIVAINGVPTVDCALIVEW